MPHLSHWYGFSPEWRRMCSIRWCLCLKALLQMLHSCGRFPAERGNMREHLSTNEGQRRSVFASCTSQTPNSQVHVATCTLNCVLLNYSLGLSAWKKIKITLHLMRFGQMLGRTSKPMRKVQNHCLFLKGFFWNVTILTLVCYKDVLNKARKAFFVCAKTTGLCKCRKKMK